MQFYEEVERLLGLGSDLKFLELVPKVIQHGRDIEGSAAVQSVTKQWDCNLEGEQYLT